MANINEQQDMVQWALCAVAEPGVQLHEFFQVVTKVCTGTRINTLAVFNDTDVCVYPGMSTEEAITAWSETRDTERAAGQAQADGTVVAEYVVLAGKKVISGR